VLNASQTASGTGNNTASLFSNSWQAGDRIIGMGIQYTGTTRGSTFFFHRDAGGNNIAAASSFGASDGVFSHDVSDSSSYMTTTAGNPRGQVRQYSVWNGFSQNGSPQEGNITSPYSGNANPAFGRFPQLLEHQLPGAIVVPDVVLNVERALGGPRERHARGEGIHWAREELDSRFAGVLAARVLQGARE
jgi:hypothetical protein